MLNPEWVLIMYTVTLTPLNGTPLLSSLILASSVFTYILHNPHTRWTPSMSSLAITLKNSFNGSNSFDYCCMAKPTSRCFRKTGSTTFEVCKVVDEAPTVAAILASILIFKRLSANFLLYPNSSLTIHSYPNMWQITCTNFMEKR